jgi:hypothetical protein
MYCSDAELLSRYKLYLLADDVITILQVRVQIGSGVMSVAKHFEIVNNQKFLRGLAI